MQRHAGAFGALHLGDDVLAVLAQAGAFGRDEERVEKLLHRPRRRRPPDPRSAAVSRVRRRSRGRGRRSPILPSPSAGKARSASRRGSGRRARSAGGVRPAANSSPNCGAVVLGQPAQFGIEGHREPALCLGIEQRALRHGAAGHLLQAERLRAELHLVGAVELRLAALVFDGICRLAIRPGAELDQIGDAREVQPLQASGSAVTRRRPRLCRAPASCATSCSTRPSAVKRFSSQSRSIWISAACRSSRRRVEAH